MSMDDGSSGGEALSTHAPTTIPEESTPVSPASGATPLEPGTPAEAHTGDAGPSQQPAKQQAGRFIEIISTDGSRASAEDNADQAKQAGTSAAASDIPETEMRAVRTTKIFRKNSKKNTTADANGSTSQLNTDTRAQQHTPSTDGSTKKASPHPNELSSPSSEGGRHGKSFRRVKGNRSDPSSDPSSDRGSDSSNSYEHDYDDETHPILAALYPLTNFIGYRPLSHPHTPAERRRNPGDPGFNRFHYICGRIFSFGLPVSGESGEIARYRNPDTGKIELVQMYKDQVGAKVINSIHSLIAAWVVIALLSLVSRSPFHRAHQSPLIIGAFATEAVVTFFAYRTPLAQPKNIFMGNLISSVIGVAMEKAFEHTNYSVNGVYGTDWAAAATAVSVAVFSMQILGFTHPPGAAIALLSITNNATHHLDWWLIPIVIIASLIVIGWALIINNLGGRRYPENWVYANAFADPPIIGPEKLPFTNSPYEPPRLGRHRKRKREEQGEKGFYRVPDSGAKVTHQFGSGPQPQPKSTVAAASGPGGAGKVRHMPSSASQNPNGSRFSFGTGAIATNGTAAEDGRLTRASEVTKVESMESNPPLQTQPAPAATASGVNGQRRGSAADVGAGVKSRMIETDATVVSRNNSKGSKKSRRSVIVHVNEDRRHSTGSAGHSKAAASAPPVPAIQWRS